MFCGIAVVVFICVVVFCPPVVVLIGIFVVVVFASEVVVSIGTAVVTLI